ncbi:MAG: NAD-dependent epimerase/dehydratase family protein [Tsuneonella sp.]
MTSTHSKHARIVLTGPTGWIGRALLALMHRAGDIDSVGGSDELSLFGSGEGTVTVAGGPELAVRALAQITPSDVAGAHVIHLAYLTKDKVAGLGDAEFYRANRAIDDALMSAITAAKPASLFVASSGAAHLAQSGQDDHPYGMAKLEQERRYLDWARESGVPTLCGRIFNVAGPHINKLDAYAVSNFAVQALRDGHIKIAATQPVFRSFLHVEDLCRIVLRAAKQRLNSDRPLDLCGAELLEMQDIAELVAREVEPDIPVSRLPLHFDDWSEYLGCAIDTWLLAARLSVRLSPAQMQVRDTVNWIRDLEGQASPRALAT